MMTDFHYGAMIEAGFRNALRGNNPFVLLLGGLITTVGSILTVGLLAGPLLVGLARVSLRVVRGEEAEVDDLKAGFHNFLPSFIAGLLIVLLVATGMMLLIVPGVAALFVFMYTAHVLADDPDLTGIEAMRRSYAMAKAHLSPTTVLLVIAAAMSAVLSATGIGAIVAVAFIAVLTAEFYLEARDGSAGGPAV